MHEDSRKQVDMGTFGFVQFGGYLARTANANQSSEGTWPELRTRTKVHTSYFFQTRMANGIDLFRTFGSITFGVQTRSLIQDFYLI
jgi:hypothetical protein